MEQGWAEHIHPPADGKQTSDVDPDPATLLSGLLELPTRIRPGWPGPEPKHAAASKQSQASPRSAAFVQPSAEAA